MLQNNPNFSETVGTVSKTTTLFNGQADVHTYSADEKKAVQPTRYGVHEAMRWEDVQNKKILGVGFGDADVKEV